MKQMPRNKKKDFRPRGSGFCLMTSQEAQPPGRAPGPCGRRRCLPPRDLQGSELLGNNKHRGFLVMEVLCVCWCHQDLSFWKSGNDWFFPISCVSSFREKQCLEICILPCSDPPTGGGESALSSHILLLGIQHEAAQRRVSCPIGEPCSLALQDILTSMSPLCCPSQLSTPPGPGSTWMKGQSKLEWGRLASRWIVRDLFQLGPSWLHCRVIWSIPEGLMH